MKNTNRWLLIAIVLLSIIIAVYYFTSSNSTIRRELSNFAVKDTASIDKIFMADKNNHQVTLERVSATEWTVDGKEPARKDGIRLLLETICDMAVRNPVPKSMEATVLRDMAGASQRKVELYSKDKLIKTFYVGSESPDNEGTYMMLEGSSVPFEVHIPGFRGILNVRFNPKADVWSDPFLFSLSAKTIRFISYSDFEKPENSYTLSYDGQFQVAINEPSGKLVLPIDTAAAFAYLAQFKQLNYEAKVDNSFEGYKKIMDLPDFARIKVIDENKKEHSIKFKRRWPIEGQTINGKPAPYDVDRCYAYIEKNDELVLAQYFVVDRILLPLSYFTIKK